MILLQILFLSCVLALLHSYLFYPFILWLLSFSRKNNKERFVQTDELPHVTILLAVYNEESVIEEKVHSIFKTGYSINKLEFFIGNDSSIDHTLDLLKLLRKQYAAIRLFEFASRTGKAEIINTMAKEAQGEILILTDANVMFTEATIMNLVSHFKNKQIAVVAGNIQSTRLNYHGVSYQESFYQNSENTIKLREGILWGAMMGAFGGCYAVRKNMFTPTPPKFIVDDFFITLAAIEKGGLAIFEPGAVCYEEVSNVMKEEYRRKSRIATGNYQIISRFFGLLSPAKGGIAFAFLSHKVLRWMGPFFIIGAYLISFALSFNFSFYKILFAFQTVLLLIPLTDWMLRKLNLHIPGLRYISHFYVMNAALMNGFIKFLTGVKNNVWQPTKRNQ